MTIDKGAKINEVAASVRRLASSKLQGSDLIAALQTALGAQVAASIIQRNPNAGADSQMYTIDQVLDGIAPGVRDAAYIEANLPDPQPYGDRELTADEFVELTNRIVNAATKNNVPVTESVTATAKALGAIICILAERPDVSIDKLIEFAQQAVADFTRQGIEFRRSQERDVPVEKIDSRHSSGPDVVTASKFEGVPISRLVDTRHELTALINQNLYGGGSKPEGQAALIARNSLDKSIFGMTDDTLVAGSMDDLRPLKRGIILETYGELLEILDDYARRFGNGGKAVKQGMAAIASDPDVLGRFDNVRQAEIQAIAAGLPMLAQVRFDRLHLSIRTEVGNSRAWRESQVAREP